MRMKHSLLLGRGQEVSVIRTKVILRTQTIKPTQPCNPQIRKVLIWTQMMVVMIVMGQMGLVQDSSLMSSRWTLK